VSGVRVQGPRIALRVPRAQDAEALFALGSDVEVTRFFSWGPYGEAAQARAWLESLPELRRTGQELALVIVDADDVPVGVTSLTELHRRDRRAVVGTWLGRAHWGTGVNADSKALVAHLAFGPLRLLRLGAYADVRNVRSQRALERLGFEREGVLREFHRHGGQPRDVASYALLRDAWRRGPLAGVPVTCSGEPPPSFVA
jgi:ribosomal-protein-alanine N-acetyltransferase